MQACGNRQSRSRNSRNRALSVFLTAGLKYSLGHFLDEQWNAIGTLLDVLSNTRR